MNNPVQPLMDPPILFDDWRRKPRYAVYQLEVGLEGTPHLQGYVCFDRHITGNALKNLFVVNPHLEPRNGSHSQAKTYCMKMETRQEGPWEYGDDEGIADTQGSRTDLSIIKRKLDEGASLRVISEEHFSNFVRYHKSFREYKRLRSSSRSWEMEIIVLVGKTGTGKSRWVHETFGEDLYSVPQPKSSGTYWDDYDGQETVLVDEMYGKRFSHSFLLELTDRYKFTVPVHGSAVNFSSKRIVFCSNAHPKEWYTSMYEKTMTDFWRGPLHRRMVQGDSFIAKCEKFHDVEIIRDEDGIAIDTRNVVKYRKTLTEYKDWE